ncbi:MAG TPA: hypothetical protein VLX44_02105 [Xanthobacteraceae bacterium]|nr:hypothetical protein [Xanthobacteraceae bacterium]
MLRWFLRRQIAAFERTWNYDAGYVKEMIETDPAAVLAFLRAARIGLYHKDIPPAAHHAAKIVGVMSEDCGPCTQLAIGMAERDGVDPAVLRAVVARDYAAMPYEVALAARFAALSLRHAPEADDVREEVVRLWGKRALIALAFALTAARIFPTVKYALGHGHACTRLTIGGETRPVLRDVTKAA